eukprot:2134859-Ditylum_brightwellii.AAC.2
MLVVLLNGPAPLPVLIAAKCCWTLSRGSRMVLWRLSLYSAGGALFRRSFRAPWALPWSAKAWDAESKGVGKV